MLLHKKNIFSYIVFETIKVPKTVRFLYNIFCKNFIFLWLKKSLGETK